MEDVLEVYHLPYNPEYPVVCMDESCKQMIGEVRQPIPCAPGRPKRMDDEYVRNGVAEIAASHICVGDPHILWLSANNLKWLLFPVEYQ
jgi:hypothetical protein